MQLHWFGHVARMPESRNPRMVWEARYKGRRTRGRPRTKWQDNIQNALLEKGVDWRQALSRAQDRKRWQALCQTSTPDGSRGSTKWSEVSLWRPEDTIFSSIVILLTQCFNYEQFLTCTWSTVFACVTAWAVISLPAYNLHWYKIHKMLLLNKDYLFRTCGLLDIYCTIYHTCAICNHLWNNNNHIKVYTIFGTFMVAINTSFPVVPNVLYELKDIESLLKFFII
jgi:hypothetical protein